MSICYFVWRYCTLFSPMDTLQQAPWIQKPCICWSNQVLNWMLQHAVNTQRHWCWPWNWNTTNQVQCSLSPFQLFTYKYAFNKINTQVTKQEIILYRTTYPCWLCQNVDRQSHYLTKSILKIAGLCHCSFIAGSAQRPSWTIGTDGYWSYLVTTWRNGFRSQSFRG